jgi:hypothetical protein
LSYQSKKDFVKVLSLFTRKARSVSKLAKRQAYRACQKLDFTWRYVANLKPALEYRRIHTAVSDFNNRVMADLKNNGIAITSVQELLGNSSLFTELQAAVLNREASLAAELETTRHNPNTNERHKTYVVSLLGPSPRLDINDIFVQFALQREILNIAINYFGMLVKLRAYNVWHNFATGTAPRASQLWHRDSEDRAVVKVFVYLTDIDERAGPLCYASGTHAQGSVKIEPPFTIVKEHNSYVPRSDDVQMKQAVPESKWVSAVGPKGTIVFADTQGYHKGGWVLDHERILYFCMFASQACTDPEAFQRKDFSLPSDLDPSVTFAIAA